MDELFWQDEITRLSRSAGSPSQLLGDLRRGRFPGRVRGLQDSACSYLIAELWTGIHRPVVVVCPDPGPARQLFRDLLFFLQRETEEVPALQANPLVLFPPYDQADFREFVPQTDLAATRLAALYALLTHPETSLCVTSLAALAGSAIPRTVLSENVDYLSRGEETDREKLLVQLVAWGYNATPLVEEPGDFSVRGGVLDIFPPLYTYPVRIEFFGDLVESIREFNPATQRSLRDRLELYLLPSSEVISGPEGRALSRRRLQEARGEGTVLEQEANWLQHRLDQDLPLGGAERWLNWFYDPPGGLADYLPESTLWLWVDPLALARAREAAGQPEGEEFFQPDSRRDYLFLEDLPIETGASEEANHWDLPSVGNRDIRQKLRSQPSSREAMGELVRLLSGWLELGQEIWLVVSQEHQAKRLKDILGFYQLSAAVVTEKKAAFGRLGPGLRIITGRLSAGFRLKSPPLIFITEEEIFELKKESRKKGPTENLAAYVSSLDDLRPGDLVVHRAHGVGRYQGLQRFSIDGLEGEFLFLEYAEGDKLFLPVDRLQGIHKFLGLEGQEPRLDRLGGLTWGKTKTKVKKAVEKIAQELVELYALRALTKGFAFSPRDQLFKEFEAGFPYEETPDQLKAIEEVLGDMEAERPMDRLVCGDVGYGKTEVALRAIFKAVMDGKQAAFLVPTTVLAEQHYQTMRQRFEGYPIEVRILSRFKSPREQQQTLRELAAGKVDVLVGTHRLLQKDVHFRELGLIVVDEEHRFGVTHKERLKTLRAQVDCLTLTATPIPRTLHMSLSGIRDLSTIETPPEDRQSIRTTIIRFEEEKIKEAVTRELDRGGQVFFVHNRVHNIQAMAHFLGKILPQVRIGVAHGQLPERELERVMLQFVNREIDLLVCTTIIESGLDIPSANTIIINQADRLGLAQMYQLRGRVGRSRERAYAYLVISGESTLSRDAQKRLKVLMDFSELGAGFKIALHDLQIRGAGNLLGTTQSGHIAAVGYELYMEMLEQAIQTRKGEPLEEDWEPEVRVRAEAFIPETYVPDPGHRLSIYKRLASTPEGNRLADLKEELRDRFGPVPEPMRNLFLIITLKLKMKLLGIQKMEILEREIGLTLAPRGHWKADRLVDLVRQDPRTYRLQGDGRLSVARPEKEGGLEAADRIVSRLEVLLG
ncbi:MAG: transcription-repair coupling factor [Deltaproteobacteria bacterium]|nr:transcription-repair coupling factor [Deltaproteobacteria bacterium]